MILKDAYFQLNVKNDGTYLVFVPAQGGSKNLVFEEIDEYLNKYLHGVDYDKTLVTDALRRFSGNSIEIKLSDNAIPQVSESVKVYISDNKMIAHMKVFPPSVGGPTIAKQEIVNELIRFGIKYGVKEEEIDNFVANRYYNRKILVAEATKAVEGKNAEIIYYFNTDLTLKPKTNDDGSVDFHSLDTISHVSAGDILAELIPAVQGKPGIDVCGGLIKPMKVTNKVLKHGQMIKISDDGLKMYSEVDGHATLTDDRVFVSNMYEVPANVDSSTGDIKYDGNVNVKGNVMTGYRIDARGDVVVDGVVEGATIVAGGQIILRRGIQGMSRGVLKAGGNVISKFIESATVESGGYVTAEAIMHSHVNAKGDVVVNGKKGFISGGEIHSGSMVTAKTVGSSMGTTTLVEVGINPDLMDEYREMEKESAHIEEEKEKITQNMVMLARRVKMGEKLPPDKLLYIKESNGKKQLYDERLQVIEKRMNELRAEIENNDSGSVRIQGTVYPGTRITISNIQYHVKQELMYCKFVRDRADIKMEPL